jgi:hypothetical protein
MEGLLNELITSIRTSFLTGIKHCKRKSNIYLYIWSMGANILIIIILGLNVMCMSDCRRGLDLVVGFIEHLQIVTKNIYSAITNSHKHTHTHTYCSSLPQVLSFVSLLYTYLHQSLPDDVSQQCPLNPCSGSYRLTTVPQLTPCSDKLPDWRPSPTNILIF